MNRNFLTLLVALTGLLVGSAAHAGECLRIKLNGAKEIPESLGKCAFEKFGSFEEYRKAALPALIKLLGLEEMQGRKSPKRTAPETLWTREFPWGKVTKLRFEFEPEDSGCAYFCVPKDAAPPYKVFICLQGHSTGMHNSIAVDKKDEKTPIAVEGDRDLAIRCAKFGFAALCLEQRGLGERSNPARRGGCQLLMCQNLLIGQTLIGNRVLDVDCMIDYLETRSDVDHSFVGVMGNSGGGTTTMFADALLPRITHLMPSCAFSSFRGSIGSKRHCACNYIPDLLFFGEAADVMGLAAPRKLVIINGEKDTGFPIGESRRQFERLKKIYSAAGASANLRHVVGKAGHRFYADEGFAALQDIL